jgi:hypothetical protein
MIENERPDLSTYLPDILRKAPNGKVVLATFFDDTGFVALAYGSTEEELVASINDVGVAILNYEPAGKGDVKYELATVTKRSPLNLEYELTELGTNEEQGLEKAFAVLR